MDGIGLKKMQLDHMNISNNLLREAVRMLNRIIMTYYISGIPNMPHRHNQSDQGKVICFLLKIKNPGFGSREEPSMKMKREFCFDDSPELLGILAKEQRMLHTFLTVTEETSSRDRYPAMEELVIARQAVKSKPLDCNLHFTRRFGLPKRGFCSDIRWYTACLAPLLNESLHPG
jgi:hypothetical protein